MHQSSDCRVGPSFLSVPEAFLFFLKSSQTSHQVKIDMTERRRKDFDHLSWTSCQLSVGETDKNNSTPDKTAAKNCFYYRLICRLFPWLFAWSLDWSLSVEMFKNSENCSSQFLTVEWKENRLEVLFSVQFVPLSQVPWKNYWSDMYETWWKDAAYSQIIFHFY